MISKYSIILMIMICFGWSIATVSAQRCINPATGGAIPCPKNNNDKPDQPEPTSTPSNDRDGDGLSDESDHCPDAGGHVRNLGCPEDETDNTTNPAPEPTAISLPILPTDGRCMLATQGAERVNVRDIPSLNGQIVGQLDPLLTYPVHLHLLGEPPTNDNWYLISLGWVSETVVRLGGDCDSLPTHDLGLAGVMINHATSIRRVSPDTIDPASAQSLPPYYLQFCDGSVKVMTENPMDCDGNEAPFDGSKNLVECDGSVHDIATESDNCSAQLSNFKMIINEDDEVVAIVLYLSLLGFNPQPEPPPFCLASMGLPSNGLTEQGFNPQPDPPTDGGSSNSLTSEFAKVAFNPQPEPPACLLLMNGEIFGDGGIALLGGMSGEQGIIVVDGYGGPDANEQGIIIINGYGGPDANEQGIIIINGYGGPNADELGQKVQKVQKVSELPADTKWTGIGNYLIIGESEGQVFVCPASETGFDPQPDPPAEGDSSNSPTSQFAKVAFNPQPEPPAQCLNMNAGF